MNYYNFNFQVPLFLNEIKLLHKLAWFPMNRFINCQVIRKYLLNLNLTQSHYNKYTVEWSFKTSKRSLSRFHPFDDCLLKKLGVASLCKWLSRNSSAKGESKITRLWCFSCGFLFMCLKWCEFDPTNNIISGERHIVTAYAWLSDISPLKGIILVQENIK
jgi:hypothetical protein